MPTIYKMTDAQLYAFAKGLLDASLKMVTREAAILAADRVLNHLRTAGLVTLNGDLHPRFRTAAERQRAKAKRKAPKRRAPR
jgi:hypothetical protein